MLPAYQPIIDGEMHVKTAEHNHNRDSTSRLKTDMT